MAENKSGGWAGQVMAAIAVALLAGGTSPWWWSEIKSMWRPEPSAVASPASDSTETVAASTAPSAPAPSAPAPPPAAREPVGQPQESRTPQAVAPAPVTRGVARNPAPAAAQAPADASAPTENMQAYRSVQRLYESARTEDDCAALAGIVKNMQRYSRGEGYVPGTHRSTVRYPRPLARPTIGDLTMDRISRIKLSKPACFP
jgi:hypothetical protein